MDVQGEVLDDLARIPRCRRSEVHFKFYGPARRSFVRKRRFRTRSALRITRTLHQGSRKQAPHELRSGHLGTWPIGERLALLLRQQRISLTSEPGAHNSRPIFNWSAIPVCALLALGRRRVGGTGNRAWRNCDHYSLKLSCFLTLRFLRFAAIFNGLVWTEAPICLPGSPCL